MSDELIAFVLLVAVSVALIVTKLIPMWRAEGARRYRAREAERFKREPRVGDKAGYHVRDNVWMVGVIVYVEMPYVDIELTYSGLFGGSSRRDTRPVKYLRWFPPNTPLGVNVVKNEPGKESHNAASN